MHRFFITSLDKISEKEIVIVSDDLLHQFRNVLRFEAGEKVGFFDGDGFDYEAELSEVGKKMARGKILTKRENEAEPKIKIALYFGILKSPERVEFILQKGTEVGVSEFVPLITERTERPTLHKRERLERIIKEAAEQSGRGFIPKLSEPEKLKDVFAKSAKTNEGINIIAHPETKNSIAGVYGKIKKEKINLFIGPEGGFSENEISSAQESGFLAFSLGKRILRAETAAITIPAVLLAL